jgi:hypothetical protein
MSIAQDKLGKMARYTPEIYEAICKDLETTWEGLVSLCKKHNVDRSCFYDFRDKNQANADRYARAREKQLDYLEELMIQLSMKEDKDLISEDKVNLGSNVIARARLQVDTIKFVLAKLRANVWGQKVEVTHKGEPRIFNL